MSRFSSRILTFLLLLTVLQLSLSLCDSRFRSLIMTQLLTVQRARCATTMFSLYDSRSRSYSRYHSCPPRSCSYSRLLVLAITLVLHLDHERLVLFMCLVVYVICYICVSVYVHENA